MFGSIAKEGLLKFLIQEVEKIPVESHNEGETVKQQVLLLLQNELRAVEFD